MSATVYRAGDTGQPFLRAADIHERVGNGWPGILAQLGVPEEYLREKIGKRERHGPCPGCGGTDRYFFDNKYGRGDYHCRGCGHGDGFKLLQLVHGWPFLDALKRVIEAAGLSTEQTRTADRTSNPDSPVLAPREVPAIARAPERVLRLRRDLCAIEDCDAAVDYLADTRKLWPLPKGCTLRGHSTVEYWHEGQRIGRYPAIVAEILDINGELVTFHVTYLQGRQKLTQYEPRKILSPLTGREGCAVRLMPATDTLGIAEGIETALSAAMLDDLPVWAALNTSLLSRFEPPPGVSCLRIYADRDEAGLTAALKLFERLQGRIRVEVRIPTAPAKDWNDALIACSRSVGKGLKHE
jgi:putative DNA primase/helicase